MSPTKPVFDNAPSWVSNFLKSEKDIEQVFVLTDKKVNQHCVERFNEDLKNLPRFIVEGGEPSKSLDQVSKVYEWLLNRSARRDALIIGIGGGVVTDLAGFVAATYKRGVRCIYVPTSLLGMVDASIGGKTGVNFQGIKNQIGTITQPEAIIIDTSFLESLPNAERLSGQGEMLKHGLIADKNHFEAVSKGDLSHEIVRDSALLKWAIVERDVSEQGERKNLNLGHTVGHAIEAHMAKKGESYSHGHCIAMGLIVEIHIARVKGGLELEIFKFIVSKITALFPKIEFFRDDISSLIDLMRADKKSEQSSGIPVICLGGIGEVKGLEYLSSNEMTEALEYYINQLAW